MSGGLVPSKSTVYVSNLPFSLTSNDLHKIFEKYGRVVKVTVVKDHDTRKSKGVAFVLYIDRESAHDCVHALNNTEMFGRSLKCSIAKDNGRAREFIRRKVYKDKSRCYECGDEGHLSYKCPANLLGEREPPTKKNKKEADSHGAADSDEDHPAADSLAAAIQYQHQQEDYHFPTATTSFSSHLYTDESEPKKKKYKKDSYFSDEEELDDT